MNKRLLWVLTTCSALVSATASAETLGEYVINCKADLGITTTLPQLDCNNGFVFAPSRGQGDKTNDYVGYTPINDAVDAVFACRWLGTLTSTPTGPKFLTAASVEMLIHNRKTGHTCFFAAKNPGTSITGVSTQITSPDESGGAADTYWMYPGSIDTAVVSSLDPPDQLSSLRCVGCHAAGPYIASPRIAPSLARFGLLNDGHDTQVDWNVNDMLPGPHYSVVGSSPANNPMDPTNPFAFRAWQSIIAQQFIDNDQNGRPDGTCSGACHSIAYNSTGHSLSMGNQTLIPPMSALIPAVINLDPSGNVVQTIMPPVTYSDYRWVNMDTPTNVATGDTGDIETLQQLQQKFPLFSCGNGVSPSFVQAHVVGSDVIYDTSGYQDKLHFFNLRDGLSCLSAEQPGSRRCLDYQTRYQCPTKNWTGWINVASGAADDNEARSNPKVSAAITSACGLMAGPVIAVQARFTIPGTTNVVTIDGPPDRLAEFDNQGLRCNNGDQGNGLTCSNYVVRFVCPAPAPASLAISTLNTPHIDMAGQKTVLTESNGNANTGINNQNFAKNNTTMVSTNKAQQWVIEPVTDFTNSLLWTIPVSDRPRAVRLRSNSNGLYATTNDVNKGTVQAPSFFLLAQAKQPTWTTQIWIKEPIAVPDDDFVRLRTAWVPPDSKTTVKQLFMTLTTGKNNDTGIQDVFIQPATSDDVQLQEWALRGLGGPTP